MNSIFSKLNLCYRTTMVFNFFSLVVLQTLPLKHDGALLIAAIRGGSVPEKLVIHCFTESNGYSWLFFWVLVKLTTTRDYLRVVKSSYEYLFKNANCIFTLKITTKLLKKISILYYPYSVCLTHYRLDLWTWYRLETIVIRTSITWTRDFGKKFSRKVISSRITEEKRYVTNALHIFPILYERAFRLVH